MLRVSFRGLCLAIVLLGAAALAAEPTSEQKKLIGTWKPVEAKLGDIQIDQEVLDKFTLVNEAEQFTITIGDDTHGGTFTIDPTQTPRTMDLFYTQGPNNGQTTVAVYEVEDDKLTVCYSLNSNMRPTELSSAGDQIRVLVKYERKKD